MIENCGCTHAMPELIRTVAARDLFTERVAPTNVCKEILL